MGKRIPPGVTGRAAQLFFDTQKLIVFGDAIGPCGRAGFDLNGVYSDDEIGNRVIFTLTTAVADDHRPPRAHTHLGRGEGFGQGPDLVELARQAVDRPLLNRPCHAFGVRHQQVVADNLNPLPTLAVSMALCS
jgi:hypothetical protein